MLRLLLCLSLLAILTISARGGAAARAEERVALPRPTLKGALSLEEALAGRRSVREFRHDSLTLPQISQLLWAAQGITHEEGHRTAPSPGALYPLEVYVVQASGLYHYDPSRHDLTRRSERDLRRGLHRAALGQEPVLEAPAVFVIAAVYERTEGKYGRSRTPRYVHMEAGHAAQNLLLQAVALGLGGAPIEAFEDAEVQRTLALPADEKPLYLIPVGTPR